MICRVQCRLTLRSENPEHSLNRWTRLKSADDHPHADGKLLQVSQTAKIKEGPRPICQATKLLDADPLVRRICERDLLFMGRPALDYLREQRDLAGPELRRAIDRVIARILREDD